MIVFAEEKDARRVEEVLPKRLARFGLQLHPDKTRLVRFQAPRAEEKPPRSEGPGAFFRRQALLGAFDGAPVQLRFHVYFGHHELVVSAVPPGVQSSHPKP